MKLLIPEYYHKFHCIASDCPDSCCKEWTVDVDDESAARYRNLQGPLGDRLRQVLTDTDGGAVMVIEEGRCPMWRQDGLCRIQAELGHEALCQVCRDFPRLRQNYGDYVELGLEMSCPEAARLILSQATDTVSEEIHSGGECCDDPEALEILQRSRDTFLQFMETTSLPLPQTLAILLLYGHEVQSELDGGTTATLESETLLAEAAKFARPGQIQPIMDFLGNLEILTDRWQKLLQWALDIPVWSEYLRRFARYLIRRYWLQALWDYDLICRIKFIITACLVVAHLPGDVLHTGQLFSKEIENDPDNLDALLDAAYTSPAFTDLNLLGLLLS